MPKQPKHFVVELHLFNIYIYIYIALSWLWMHGLKMSIEL